MSAPSPAPPSVRLTARILAPLLGRVAHVLGAVPDELRAVHLAAAREAHARRGPGAVLALAVREGWDALRTLWRQAPPPLQGLRQDVRGGLRQLARRPGFTALAVLALGLGIGANTAIFTVVKGVLLDALPYEDPHDLVRVYSTWEGTPRGSLSTGEFMDYRAARSFSAMGAMGQGSVNLTGEGGAERLDAAFVSAGLLEAVGVRAAHGRLFTADEYVQGADDAVLLSHGFWQRRFGGDAEVVGSTVVLDGTPTRIVGILPRDFRLPTELAGAEPSQIVAAFSLAPADSAVRGSHFLTGVARLAPGATLAGAAAELDGVVARFTADWPEEYPVDQHFGALVVPLQQDVVGDVRPLLLVLLGAVGLVLLMACVNVAGLLLARSDERTREFAVRTALGAGRVRLARQLTVESLLLALAGGAAGVALASAAVPALLALQPPDVPRLHEVSLDGGAVLFALVASIATGLAFGLAPLGRVLGSDVGGRLRDGQRAGTTRAGHRFRRGLVVVETALAIVLVAGAGLLLHSFSNLLAVDPGYVTEGVLATRASVPAASYPDNGNVVDFYRRLTARLEALPGVRSAGAVTNLPLDGSLGDLGVNFERWFVPEGELKPSVDWQVVTPGYFETLGMRMAAGRGIRPTDDASAPGVVVFNRAAVAAHVPEGVDPLGLRLLLGGGAGPGWVTLVGVVEDVRHAALDAPPRPEMYLPHAQFTFWGSQRTPTTMNLVVRTAGDPSTLAPEVRRVVRDMDPDVPLATFQTLVQKRAASVARHRFALTLLAVFAVVALVLAAIGIYGVFAYSVRRRVREVAVRMAMGARAGQVAGLVLREAALLSAAGALVGLAGALALGRALGGLLYGVGPADPLTLAAATLLLPMVALLATWIPAHRATRVSPARTLREDG